MTRPNYQLMNFVQHLHDIHSDLYGFNVGKNVECEATDRCIRWMDAVLPPPPLRETTEVPFLEEAAE